MKNKPKRLPSHDPRPRGRLKKGILHLLRPAGFALILCILLALLHLLTIGIPEPLTRKITEQLQKNGVPLQVDSITLSAHRGWVLHNARLFSTNPDDLNPLIQADRLYIHIRPEDWTPLSRTEWYLRIYCKKADISLGLLWENELDGSHPFRTVQQLRARLHVSPSRITIDRSEANWGGFVLRAAGQAEFPKQKKPADPARYRMIQSRVTQAADLLAGLMFSAPPEISLHFNIPADTPENIQMDASLLAAGLRRQGTFYDRITGAAHLRDDELHLDSLQIARQNNGRLQASGRYDFSAGTAEMEVNNTLPFSSLLSLLPQRIAAAVASSEFRPTGAAEFRAIGGPCPPQQLAEQLRVQIHNLPVTYQDLVFDPLRADLTRSGSRLEITNIVTKTSGHPLTADIGMDLNSGAWNFSAQGRVPTAPVGRLLGGTAQEWIDRFEFPGTLPDIAAEASWGGEAGTFNMRSSVSGQDAVCAGVPLDTIDLTMSYSNRTFALSPLRATRGDQAFSGNVKLDFDQNLAFFDAESSFAPGEVAQIIAPDHLTVLTNFTFAGALSSSASGRIDYSGATGHAVQGSIRAEAVSAGRLTADSFQSRVEARGNELIFSGTTVSIFDGTAEGSAVFDLQFNDDAAPYRLNMTAAELDLAALLRHFGTEDPGSTKGRLSGTLDLAADAKQGFWASANGKGAAEIREGNLRDLPVLGGFSRLIRTTLPGFSLFSLTTFYSEFELRDGALRSENTQLGGTLFSARARGKYSPQAGLDFLVRAEPLRQTRENKEWYQIHLWGADVLKQGTAPFFDLLEFRLTGPLEKPDWRMNALPKEAYNLFEKLTPSSAK